MTRKNPPAAANWILEHLNPSGKNDALLGDLLEEFRSGRSSGWYWRQALSAVISGFARGLREHWLALLFAALWTIPVPALDIFVLRRIQTMHFFSQRWDLVWPYSTICDVALTVCWDVLYVWVGLLFCFSAFSIATKTLDLGRIIPGLWASAVVYIAMFAGVMVYVNLSLFHSPLVDIRSVTPLSVMTKFWFLPLRIPYVVALLIGILAAFPAAGLVARGPDSLPPS